MQFDRLARLLYIGAVALFACVALLLPLKARAMPFALDCLPASPAAVHSFVSLDGACAWYSCRPPGATVDRVTAWCGPVSEWGKVGGRLATIIKAADPLKSAQTADKRFPIADLNGPEFATLRAQMCDRGGPCALEPWPAAASAP